LLTVIAGYFLSRIAAYTCSMTNETTMPRASVSTTSSRSLPMRLWLAAPDWLFRVAGFVFFALFSIARLEQYIPTDPSVTLWEYYKTRGPWCQFADGTMIRMPWVPVLVDLTYLLIMVSFIVRINPKQRASDGKGIALALLAGFA